MPSSINASTTAGVVTTADTSGVLNIQTAGTTAISIDASQAVSFTNQPTYSSGTANGVAYLNGSKVLTTGSALVFDGSNLGLGVTPPTSTDAGNITIKGGSTLNFSTASANIASNATFNSGWKYIATAAAVKYTQSGAEHQWFNAASGTAGNAITFTQAMTLDASGNLLVGTTSNADQSGTFGQTLKGSSPGLTLSGTESSGRIYTIFEGGGALKFYDGSAGAERARIDSSGNFRVGVGTSTTNTYMDVNHATGSTNGASFFVARYNGTQIGDISQATTSTVAYNTSSDYRLKDNIQPMTGALAKVALLKPCTYTWKVDGAAGQGFIAHELQEIVPDCVTGAKDAVETYTDDEGNEQTRPKYQGIDTSFLVATLTAAIQEQQAIITQLQADVAALKGA